MTGFHRFMPDPLRERLKYQLKASMRANKDFVPTGGQEVTERAPLFALVSAAQRLRLAGAAQ